MSKDLSDTQALLITMNGSLQNLSQKVDAISMKVEEMREDTKTYLVTKDNVDKHTEYHRIHFKEISGLKDYTNKTKGWAAAIGFITGFIGTMIGLIIGIFKHP